MVDGVFHADPHPGNIFVAPGEPATIIDFGMIGRIDRRMALGYTRFMLAMALNDGEAAGRAALESSTLTSRSDIPGFLADMQPYIPTVTHLSLREMEFGTNFNQFIVFCTRRAIGVNSAIARFGKASANMESSLRHLVPEMAPFEVFRETMGGIVRDQVKQLHAQEELVRSANEAFFATRSVPEQARSLIQAVVNGQYAVRLRDDSRLVHQQREDARARAMRRTLVALAAATLWLDRRRQRR